LRADFCIAESVIRELFGQKWRYFSSSNIGKTRERKKERKKSAALNQEILREKVSHSQSLSFRLHLSGFSVSPLPSDSNSRSLLKLMLTHSNFDFKN
jgi:hypothetical protein